MPNIDFERLTKDYFEQQSDRTLAALNKIVGRAPVANGRVIPEASTLALYDGRRIDASVMFLDICKFSQRPSCSEQEQGILLRILSLFFNEMIRIVEDYGGVVEKNTGDGLMAYFSKEPNDKTPPQQRALSAALTMFNAADRLINPIIEASNLERIRFRVCIDHGTVTIAKVGVARGFNGIVAIGTTANVASKMLATADADTILLGTKMLPGLPEAWRQSYIKLKTSDTGWVFRDTGLPYSFWEYQGRWSETLT